MRPGDPTISPLWRLLSVPLLLALALSQTPRIAVADPATPAPAAGMSSAQALADLASPDPAARDRARAELMSMDRDALAKLPEVAKAAGPLLPSQVVVLREAAQHAFLITEPYNSVPSEGFLGAELKTLDLLPADAKGTSVGVLVSRRIIGFCSYPLLLEGDIIVGVAQQPNLAIRSHTDISALVRATRPGDTLTFQVLRRGQVISIPIVLSERPAGLDDEQAVEAFLWNRQRRADAYWRDHLLPALAAAAKLS